MTTRAGGSPRRTARERSSGEVEEVKIAYFCWKPFFRTSLGKDTRPNDWGIQKGREKQSEKKKRPHPQRPTLRVREKRKAERKKKASSILRSVVGKSKKFTLRLRSRGEEHRKEGCRQLHRIVNFLKILA